MYRKASCHDADVSDEMANRVTNSECVEQKYLSAEVGVGCPRLPHSKLLGLRAHN